MSPAFNSEEELTFPSPTILHSATFFAFSHLFPYSTTIASSPLLWLTYIPFLMPFINNSISFSSLIR